MINMPPEPSFLQNLSNGGQSSSELTSFNSKKSNPYQKRLTIYEALKSVGPLKRISSRRTRPYQAPDRNKVVFEGHGECQLHSRKIKIPDSTTFTLYTGLNCVLLEKAAIAIANNSKTPSSLRFKGTDHDGCHQADIYGERSYLTGHRRKYHGGEMVTNFMLYPPSRNMQIAQNSFTTDQPIALKDLLKIHRGKDCHWVACTVIRP